MRLTSTILCAIILCAGCASKPHDNKPSEPVAGLKPAKERAAYTSEQLGQLYIANVAFADWYLARLAAACDALAQDAATPDARYEALRLKAIQATSVYSILTSPNPIVQVLSLQGLFELTRLKWVDEGKARASFGDKGKLLTDALDQIEKRARSHALGVISENELNAIRTSAQRWRNENQAISDIEFIRFEEFVTELARSLGQQEQDGLMSSLRAAAEGLAESRLLGMRALFLFSRFPIIMQWQLEAGLADAARGPESRTLLDNLTRMAGAVEALDKQTTQIHGTLDAFPQKLADSLVSEPMLKEAVTAAKAGVLRGESATKQIAALEASVRQFDSSVNALSKQFEHFNRAYTPASVQKMAQESQVVAFREVRSLIYLISACLVALVVLHAVLRRWRRGALIRSFRHREHS